MTVKQLINILQQAPQEFNVQWEEDSVNAVTVYDKDKVVLLGN